MMLTVDRMKEIAVKSVKEYLGEKYEDLKVLWNDKKDDLSDLWQSGKQKIKNRYEKFRDENGD